MEKLYNGIELQDSWPPRDVDQYSSEPIRVPYLEKPPEVVDITVGRQLFVDDFLVEDYTNLKTVYHHPRLPEAPVFKAETPWEKSFVCAVAGGAWYDEQEKLFKLWYSANWYDRMCYAQSADGIHWERPALGVEGADTNIVIAGVMPDYTAVWIDYEEKDPEKRYKMFLRKRNDNYDDGEDINSHVGYIYTSPDGKRWTLRTETGPLGDASTMFYNAFRRKWAYSIRVNDNMLQKSTQNPIYRRVRLYREADDLIAGAHWKEKGTDCYTDDRVFWQRADVLDPKDYRYCDEAQLYNLDCVAYESIMLGSFMIYEGFHESDFMEAMGKPKPTEILIGYSRDGFHFSRPDRTPFIPLSDRKDRFDQGYVHTSGGVCVIVGDELWFYYTGYYNDKGLPEKGCRGASIGIAKLRRDGFAAITGTGDLQTRKLTVTGGKKYLFVNADVKDGMLKAEVQDAEGRPVAGYGMGDCTPVSVDTTKRMMSWQGKSNLSFLNGETFKLRFHVEGALYAFWLSTGEDGASGGFSAAGSVNPY